MDEVDDADLVVELVAALHLGKAALEACVCPTSSGSAGGWRSCAVRHHHRAAVGDGGLAAAVARAAGNLMESPKQDGIPYQVGRHPGPDLLGDAWFL